MIQLFNTLSGRIEEFKPLSNDKRVTMYVCGITPYDTTHLGHAFTYISFDLLVRTLRVSGYSVEYTQNVTDINDRDNDLLKRAKEENISWRALSKYWTLKFLSEMSILNWVKPNNYLYASKNLLPIIYLIKKILRNGFAYEIKGSVYLNTEKVKDFGKLSKYSKEEMLNAAEKFEEELNNPDKKNPLDITLWKAKEVSEQKHIPSFKSPWGLGRPGWHIECSAMAIDSLGTQIDIHGGGKDLIFPHHESEIAQSESATGKIPFARFWLHTGTVGINGEKMSKSLGNLILVSDLLTKYSANAMRLVLLSHHFSLDWSYNEQEFINAEELVGYITKALNLSRNNSKLKLKTSVIKHLQNNLDSKTALKEIIKAVKLLDLNVSRNDLSESLEILGFKF